MVGRPRRQQTRAEVPAADASHDLERGRRWIAWTARERSLDESRRYSDAEAREILRRATELEIRPTLPPGLDRQGLSLSELEEVAREAGIEPRAVRHAALARLPDAPRSLAALLRGGPALRDHVVHLPGQLSPETHRDLGRALDRVFGTDGTLEETAPGFHWREDHRQGRTRISVVPDSAGGASVALRADRRGWSAALNLVALAAGLGAGALALPATGSALVAVGAGIVVWRGLVRLAWPPFAGRLRRRLEAALVEVAARLEEDGGS